MSPKEKKGPDADQGLEYLQLQDELIDLILQNAEQLLRLAKKDFDENKLDELQKSQDLLIQRVIELDHGYQQLHELEESPKRHHSLIEQIHRKLDIFQDLNQKFIENVSIKRGLIKLELQDVEKQRRVLGNLSKAYTSKEKSKKVDTKS
jgi:uncharacterized protein Yka (UPF0111/DUF47 family)